MKGKISSFGGPSDSGVSSSEGLAIYEPSQIKTWWHQRIFGEQPEGTTGLARKLNPESYYCAQRWNYSQYSKEKLRNDILVSISFNGKTVHAQPADFGPHESTGRLIDASPAVLSDLGCQTDDEVEVKIVDLSGQSIPGISPTVIVSVGHHPKDQGAENKNGVSEWDFNGPLADRILTLLQERGIRALRTSRPSPAWTKADIESHINSQNAELVIELHANANDGTASGTEMLHWHSSTKGQAAAKTIQEQVVKALGLPDRGLKPIRQGDRGALFLSATKAPAILTENFFLDHDSDLLRATQRKEQLAQAITRAIDIII